MKPGIPLSHDVSLKVDWNNVIEKFLIILEELPKAALGDSLAGARSLVAAVQSLRSAEVELPVSARALEIIVLSFAWSLDKVSGRGEADRKNWSQAATRTIAVLKEAIDRETIEIPQDFFTDPAAAAPYVRMRDTFVEQSGLFEGQENRQITALKYRIDVAFRLAVWELWVQRHTDFEELQAVLTKVPATAVDLDRQWLAYRERLKAEFYVSPVFGQTEKRVSLAQLYVPLRCWWEVVTPVADSIEVVDVAKHITMVEEELGDWLNGDQGDWLRLLGGGPGSGKSTSAKAFAAQIADRDDVRPLFIPLQRLGQEGALRDRVNEYFVNRSGSAFSTGPLERTAVENGPPLVLIFDGLDEIARPGETADEIARETIGWIKDLHSELTGELRQGHKVLVTGRMPSFQAAMRRLGSGGRYALEVLPFVPLSKQGSRTRSRRHERHVTFVGETTIIEADQRPAWWASYSAAVGKQAGLPGGLIDPRLDGLTSEPLLCYLLALSGYLEEDSEEAADNRNRVYQRLMGDVYTRGWGEGRAGPGKDLSPQDFDKLFQTMALAAWHGGDERVATYERFEHALDVTRCRDIFEEFQRQEGGDVSNLAVNFYLKKAEGEAKGFEFTHKSFGEYLTARALLNAFAEIAVTSERRPDVALSDVLDVVNDGQLSEETISFIVDEARLKSVEYNERLKVGLQKVAAAAAAEGMPAHKLNVPNWRAAESRHRNAEFTLWAMMSCAARGVYSFTQDIDRSLVKVNIAILDLMRLLHRMYGGPFGTEAEGDALMHFDASGKFLFNLSLTTANMSYGDYSNAHMSDVRMLSTVLRQTKFIGAEMGGAKLDNSLIVETDFSGATLQRASFNRGRLRRVSFQAAILVNATFEEARLEDVDFTGADVMGLEPEELRAFVYDAQQAANGSGGRAMVTYEPVDVGKQTDALPDR